MEEAGILGNTALLNVVLPSFDPGPEMAVLRIFLERLSTAVQSHLEQGLVRWNREFFTRSTSIH
jgi:hypothetical protein